MSKTKTTPAHRPEPIVAATIRTVFRELFATTISPVILMSPESIRQHKALRGTDALYLADALKEMGLKRTYGPQRHQHVFRSDGDTYWVETAEMQPGRPFVFRRADFMNDVEQPGREATTRTTMRTREQSKAQLQRVINQQQKDLAVMASTKENQQTLIEQHARRIEDLKAKLDEAITNIDIAREQRDNNAAHTIEVKGELSHTKGQLHRTQIRRDELERICRALEGERDRARAALVEANINTSRLVDAVEPRNDTAMSA